MGDVERGNTEVRNNMMDGRGSLVTVNVERGEEDGSSGGGGNNNNNNNIRSGTNYDLGMTLAEIGMGVSFEMDEPEGVTGDEVCPRKGDVALVDGEDSLLEIPELTKSCCGLPPRTIPFRSASFSQVDVTSDGKYVRNPRSPITLKPTAFCLLNSSNQQKGATTVVVVPAATTTATIAPPTIASSSGGTAGNYNSSTIPRHGEKSSAFPSGKNSAKLVKSAKVDLLPLPPLPSHKTTAQSGPEEQSAINVENSDENKSSVPLPPLPPPPPQLLSECIPLEADESAEIPDTREPTSFSHIEDEASAAPAAACTEIRKSESTTEETTVPSHELVNLCGEQNMTDTAGIHFYLGSEDASVGVTEEFKLVSKSELHSASSEDSNLRDQPGNKGNSDVVEPTMEPTLAIPLETSLSSPDNTSEVITTNEAEASSPPPPPTNISSDTIMTVAGGATGTSDSEKRVGTLEAAMLSDDEAKSQLLRQSSGQSDGSDDIPHLNVLAASISSALDLSCSSLQLSETDPRCTFQASAVGQYGSPPSSSSSLVASSVPSLASTRGTSLDDDNAKKEISRANSVNDPNARPLPPRRYNKRPLRGPYGKMLEAEMNKLMPGRSAAGARDYDNNSDFCRESKSSSPSRSLYSSLSHVDPDPRTAALMSSNPLLMASLDDLHFTTNQSKTLNPRSRKTSSQLPAQASFPGEGAPPLAFHQRTASSPSQLLYTASSPSPAIEISGSTHGPEIRRRLLDGSPRGHVLAEVVETEKSYVDSLRILVKKYMEPLKLLDYVDAGLVDEIFFQIPKILWHHERLLDALQKRVTDDMQCVGDVLLQTFRQNSLLECYSLFVNNWKNAKASLKMAVASKPAFARFLEDNARQHKGKLTLDSLLIMPIQRIPRYELLVKELLKHTDPSHEDHARLNIALESIRQFALHIDCASVDPNDNREIEIEGWGSGLGHLVRQDMVTLCTSSNVKKERALFLFADSLVIASIKRKSTMRKPSASTSHSSSNNWEGCKFKLLMKIPLTDAHLLNEDHDGVGPGGTGSSTTSGISGSGSVTTANKSTSSSSSSSFSSKSVGGGGNSALNSHEETDDLKIIHKMMELAAMLKCSHAGLDEILKDLASNLKHHNDNGDAVDFEIKSSDNSDSPEVLKILFGSAEKKSAWLESFQDTLNKFIRYGFGKTPPVQFVQALPIRKTRAGLQLSCAAPVSLHNKVSKTLEMSDVWVANSDGYVGQICILTLHPEPAITSCNGVCNSRITCIISVPPPPPLSATPIHPALAANHHHDDHHPSHVHSLGYESEDESHRNRQGNKSIEHWSVWLGTEDGGLHVYDCSDSVRVKKNRHKIQHSAPLHCIVYFGNRVVVSLGNGDVAVYSRNTSGKGWSISDPSWVTIGSALYPVTKMICVRSQIWCACGSQIKVYGENGGMLELLQAIQVTIEGSQVTRGISCIAASDEHVWVAVQGTSIIKCYNNTTFECLLEMNVSADVTKILAGCDDIIRQHKSACLRVTALLYAPDKTLWVGTSAGAILTVTYVNHSYKTTPLCHGHTGQVRFMTCCTSRDSCTIISGGDGYEEFRPLTPLFQPSSNNSSSFGSMMSSLMGESSVDISGREDSTNHLLIWRIPKPSDT